MENRRLLGLAPCMLCAILASLANPQPQSAIRQLALPKQTASLDCRKWQGEACTECGIHSFVNISLKNKTKTPLLLCQNMKPGPAKLEMTTQAEPEISGLWEVELGLGYQTSLRNECPHQFIASNNPPLRKAYEIGPLSLQSEIPQDGRIQVLACLGLSSARVGKEGRETGASLHLSKLRVVSE